MATKTIIHLDDHPLFSQSIKQLVASKMEVSYLSYQSPAYALKDIQKHLDSGLPINLIITDYNHPGITGYQFACENKKIGRECFKKNAHYTPHYDE